MSVVQVSAFDEVNNDIDYDNALKDIESEIDNVFVDKKKYTQKLSYVYKRLGYNERKIHNVLHCGDYLQFNFDGIKSKLTKANFCKDKLCPMCAKRRSLKLYHQLFDIVESLKKDYDFLFLTLTVPNCKLSDLKDVCDNMQTAFNRKFIRYTAILSAFKGYFRALEITVDNNEYITRDMYCGNSKKHLKSRKKYYDGLGLKIGDKNPNFLMCHPHFHCIVAVDKDYFTSDKYLDNSKNSLVISKLWTKAFSGKPLNSATNMPFMCDVRSCYNKNDKSKKSDSNNICIASAVAEVAKYSVKSSDYLNSTNKINEIVVDALHNAMLNRRMFAFGGIMNECSQADVDDVVNGDLVVVDGTKINTRNVVAQILYRWNGKKYELVYIYQLSKRQQLNYALFKARTGLTCIDIVCNDTI